MHLHRWLLLSLGVVAYAQDPFEIQVFEYEPLPLGAYTYEAHLNYVVDGTTKFDGPVAPLQNQFHFSSEWTAGITDQFRLGFTVFTAGGPGLGMQYAVFRILPHFYAPKSWGLPVNLGLVTEFSLVRSLFDENTRELELRGIIEKHTGRLQMDGNLVFERALRGPGVNRGWGLAPSGRLGWQATGTFTASIEYYSSPGPANGWLPGHHQIPRLVPGADWKLRQGLTWSFGLGLGL